MKNRNTLALLAGMASVLSAGQMIDTRRRGSGQGASFKKRRKGKPGKKHAGRSR